ncbi:hypothetical protein [Sphingobium chungbukense]|uniref:Uncharacterized protein n=1 Tax=Sphingobium chungbukense TaxID=56193 RepID=A0A0M3AUU8_9SPHN|nr:hypothetical protein [Sphingobium chungbukense]KKW93987.1 hypothetical protein YP76_04995 [Sphingobium chungbukense]
MHFDDQLHRYFGIRDLDALTPDALAAGLEHMRVDFGLETDKARRFALWSLMFLLGAAPDLEDAFEDPADRDAARDFMERMERAEDGGD